MNRGDMVGYRIIYGPEHDRYPEKTSSLRIRVMIALSFLVFTGLVRILWPDGRDLLVMSMLPGDISVTEAAFSSLLDHLRQGSGLVDSLTVFCREVLYEII